MHRGEERGRVKFQGRLSLYSHARLADRVVAVDKVRVGGRRKVMNASLANDPLCSLPDSGRFCELSYKPHQPV